MNGEFFKGSIEDICKELKKEKERCEGMTVEVWLRMRRIEETEANQLGMKVEELRKYGKSV